jgi:hypothetical protein
LIQHFAMLGGYTDSHFELGPGLEMPHDGRKFNSFGPRTENEENFMHEILF